MGSGVLHRGAWLVVTVGVGGELAEEFAGNGVDDSDVQVLDEQDDWVPALFLSGFDHNERRLLSLVGSADADVAELAGDAQGDGAGLVDAVVADPVVGCRRGSPWQGLGHGVIERCGCGPVRQGAMWSVLVVLTAEPVEQRPHAAMVRARMRCTGRPREGHLVMVGQVLQRGVRACVVARLEELLA